MENYQPPLINILTRTSGRPKGFNACHKSIKNQTYPHIKHWVVTDDPTSIKYLEGKVDYLLINKEELIEKDISKHTNPRTGRYSPHNLYSNVLNEQVKEGYVMYLDDDDMLKDNNCIQQIVKNIVNEDTMLFWQMRYRSGRVLPAAGFLHKKPILGDIGSPCVLFHSKWLEHAIWDTWKCSDFRVIYKLFKTIPKKKWIKQPFIQLNNNGDLGRRNDI